MPLQRSKTTVFGGCAKLCPLEFKKNQIWPPRLQELVKTAVAHSVIVLAKVS